MVALSITSLLGRSLRAPVRNPLRALGNCGGGWRHSSAASDRARPTIRLYQYEICPFCCKVKALLDWQKVPYTTVEVNPISKAELKFSEKYKKVPVAMIDETQVNDSNDIISTLAPSLDDDLPAVMDDPEIAKWLEFADKELAVLLFPNITRSFGESFQAFGYIADVPTFGAGSKAANRLAGSLAMWLANGKLKKKYNITDERKQLLDTVEQWVSAVGDGPFLRGDSPSVADVVVYGVISSIRGLTAHRELMDASPGLAAWENRMRTVLGASMRIEDPPVVRRCGPTAA